MYCLNSGVWDELQAQKCFQRISFTKYLRLTLVFRGNSALWGKFNFFFSSIFAAINKIFIWPGRLGTRLFYEAEALS